MDQKLREGESITLPKPTSHHLCTVLRLQTEDTITLFDGDGNNYPARLTSTGKTATAEILAVELNDVESPLKLELLQGISRGDRMDTTLQKAVELGITTIHPLLTDKSAVRLSGDRLKKKMQHWRGIIISACEQSGRSVVPDLFEPQTLSDWISLNHPQDSTSPKGSHWLLVPGAAGAVGDITNPTEPCRILIGPESGLSDKEIECCISAGFEPLSLGRRILRTETAGPAIIAILQSKFGDLR